MVSVLKTYKICASALLLYVVISGMTVKVPALVVLNETVRNLFFHVPMWFTMILLLVVSVWHSVRLLDKGRLPENDAKAVEAVHMALFFGLLGFVTGMVWGHFTWGSIQSWFLHEPRVTYTTLGLLIYAGYPLLRKSITDPAQRAKVGAVYNVFAFALFLSFMFVLPRITASLHPGAGGNPGFNIYDTNDAMKMVFYPAVLAWAILGLWMWSLKVRLRKIEEKLLIRDYIR